MHSFQGDSLAESFCLLIQKKCSREVNCKANTKFIHFFVEVCALLFMQI